MGNDKKDVVSLPFSVLRSSSLTLIEQVEEGIRSAIEGGVYKPGDSLPTTRQMAGALRVGRVVIERAMSRLKKRNYVSARPHLGIVVLDAGVKLWRGNVLIVTTSHAGSYYPSVFAGEVKSRLLAAGYLCMQVSADSFSPGNPDLSALKAHLRRPIDLALVLFDSPVVERCLSSAGVPFIVVGSRICTRKHCRGTIELNWNAAVPDFVGHCLAAGVTSVLQFSVRRHETVDVQPALESARITCERIFVKAPDDRLKPSNVERTSFVAMRRRLRGRKHLPDLIFFSDDHIASGALWALAEGGVGIPNDVKVVTWSNRGDVPLFPRSLTVMEMDPRLHGEKVADSVLSVLERRRMRKTLVLTPAYVRGDTF